MSFFSSDRARKYGWGLPRLALLCWLAYQVAPYRSAAVSAAEAALETADNNVVEIAVDDVEEEESLPANN